jgi:hypothetical protein
MKIAEQGQCQFASDGGKRVAVEEKKGRAAMIRAKLVEGFAQCQDFDAKLFPVRCARCRSFRVKAMLCTTSFARSSVDADDNEPVPVFEKSGSGL